MVGVAGAGKTSALGALGDVFRESGVPVVGAAPSGRAADELATATAIASSTIHRLLLDAGRDGGLPRGCVVVLDEAGMAETQVLAPLLELVEAAEGKAILVGDPAQLPAVGAGGLYPALCERLGALELDENRRQHDPSERQALARLRAGDPEPYLTHAANHGRLSVEDDPLVAKQRLLEDWWQTAAHDPEAAVMIAYRRADIHDLNEAAHSLMLRAGRLGREAHAIGEREFRVGDRVLCRHNDPQLGVRNGTRATIVELDDTTLMLQTDAGARRPLPLAYAAEHLEHGYALTGHAAQGATVERAYVLVGDQGALHEWGYVACSRARTETRLYLAHPPLELDRHGREPNLPGAPERLARALSASACEPLAVEQLETADRPTARTHLARRRELEQQRARAQQRLGEAQEKLDRLGWRGRGRRGDEIRSEIALQRAVLRVADKKLREPIPEPTTRLSRPDPVIALARDRSLRHRLTREALERTRGLERGLGIDL